MLGDKMKSFVSEMFSKGRFYGFLDMDVSKSYIYQRSVNEELDQLIESHKRCEELESIVDKLEDDNKEHELNYEYYVSSFNALKKENEQLKEDAEKRKKLVFVSVEHTENDPDCECNECSYVRMEAQIAESEKYEKLGMAIEFVRVHIDESGYTYNSINDIMQGYKKRLENYYNSYTMNIMIDDCKESLKLLYPYWYREQLGKDRG